MPSFNFDAASSWRRGSSGENLILPEASTLVETVTMIARALMRPFGVSTSSPRSHWTLMAGVESWTGMPSAAFANSEP